MRQDLKKKKKDLRKGLNNNYFSPVVDNKNIAQVKLWL